MAKGKNSENSELVEVVVDKNNPPKLEEITLKLRVDGSVLELKTTRGKNVLWTIEQALQPQNWKQLTSGSQNVIRNGVTASSQIK